jgi:hypothetical protein
MIPAKTKAGGSSAAGGSNTASREPRSASANASTPKASQYDAAISRNMLAAPGATGSITPHSTVMTGDCQSPSTPLPTSS